MSKWLAGDIFGEVTVYNSKPYRLTHRGWWAEREEVKSSNTYTYSPKSAEILQLILDSGVTKVPTWEDEPIELKGKDGTN